MKITSRAEGVAWMAEYGVEYSKIKRHESEFKERIVYQIPLDSGRKAALAKLLISFLKGAQKSLLWIKGYGIWPSSENWPLFNGYRKSLGESRPLVESECHFFNDDNSVEAECLLSMVLYFYWDALLASESLEFVIEVSHDGLIVISLKDFYNFSSIEEALDEFKLEKLRSK